MNKIQVFCSCATDEQEYLDELKEHLRWLKEKLIELWDDSMVIPGRDKKVEHEEHLAVADFLLLLVSPSFLNSSFYKQEMPPLMRRRTQKKLYIIPVLFLSVDWSATIFRDIQPLPPNNGAVMNTNMDEREEAWVLVVEGIEKAVRSYKENEATISPATYPLTDWEHDLNEARFEHFMQFTFKPKLAQFQARGQRYKRKWEELRIIALSVVVVALLLALSNFVLLGAPLLLHTILEFLLLLAIIGILVCVLLLGNARTHEGWHRYQRHADDLKHEQALYQQRQGMYRLVTDHTSLFMERVFDTIRNVGEGTRSTDETEDYFPSQAAAVDEESDHS